MLKEYKNGISGEHGIYFIDANVLVAIGNYYYMAKCHPAEITTEIVDFIIKARKYGIYNQISLMELCYDYNTNHVNNEYMQKIMIAYDYLITAMDEDEIRFHKGALEPMVIKKEDGERRYNSIFECNLPGLLCGEAENAFINVFYGIYLYLLKVYSLYNDSRKSAIEKVKELFLYMSNEIDVFLANEFHTATMLFIGVNEEKNVAKKILKPRKVPKLQHVLNAVIDVFQVKMLEILPQISIQNGMGGFYGFVTLDKALQDYIEHMTQFSTIISPEMISSLKAVTLHVDEKYRNAWEKYYLETIEPTMRKRFISAHIFPASSDVKISKKLEEEIVRMEKGIFV